MKKKTQKKPNEYPAGVFLHTEKGYFYVFSPTSRYRFITKRVMDSWSPQRVIEASEQDEAVKKAAIIAKMRFRNGSLLYTHVDGNIYLVSDNKARPIINTDWIEMLGASRRDAVWVSPEEVQLHEMGKNLE